jgi:hypothetical protein
MVVERSRRKSTFANSASTMTKALQSARLMVKKSDPFVRVRKLGRSLPGSEEGTSWGTPALKIDGQMFACIPTNKSAEANSLAVRVDFVQRDELLAADPRTYYLKDHYVNYPCVLVRLDRIHDDALRDLLRMAYEFVRARRPRRKRSRRSA